MKKQMFKKEVKSSKEKFDFEMPKGATKLVPSLKITENHRNSYIDRIVEVHSIQSASYKQQNMLDFIKDKATKYGAILEEDKEGNLYATKGKSKSYPCVVAHTDTVHRLIPKSAYEVIVLGKNIMAIDNRDCSRVGVGGDDNVGIFIALESLKNNKIIKAAFFVDEEVGCIGSKASDLDFFKDVAFCFQADRKGYNDVTDTICNTPMFTESFSKILSPVFKKYAKTFNNGGLTDVYALAKRKLNICMFNSSCGYYKPHTNNEYIVIDEVILTYLFFQDSINALYKEGVIYEIIRPEEQVYSNYSFNNWEKSWNVKWDNQTWDNHEKAWKDLPIQKDITQTKIGFKKRVTGFSVAKDSKGKRIYNG